MAAARGHKVGAFLPEFRVRVWINRGASDEVDEQVDRGVCRCAGGRSGELLGIVYRLPCSFRIVV